eukprot:COSAG06_NODE_5086_length_3732_cov_2.134049_3_plen_95_part_00
MSSCSIAHSELSAVRPDFDPRFVMIMYHSFAARRIALSLRGAEQKRQKTQSRSRRFHTRRRGKSFFSSRFAQDARVGLGAGWNERRRPRRLLAD